MVPLRIQLIASLLIGLLAGGLLRLAWQAGEPSLTEKSRPFVTHANMLAVSLHLHRSAPPEITAIQPLETGRATVLPAGDYQLELLDENGESLYAVSFRAVFLQPGEPPRPIDDIYPVLVIPSSADVRSVRISGPTGAVEAPVP